MQPTFQEAQDVRKYRTRGHAESFGSAIDDQLFADSPNRVQEGIPRFTTLAHFRAIQRPVVNCKVTHIQRLLCLHSSSGLTQFSWTEKKLEARQARAEGWFFSPPSL